MKIIPYSFIVLELFGGWVPLQWNLTLKEKLYHIYTLIVGLLVGTFSISCIVDLFLTTNIEDVVHNMSISFTMTIVCMKMALLAGRRDAIIFVFKLLKSRLCMTRSIAEADIQIKCDRRANDIVKKYGGLVCGAVFAVTGASVLENIPTRTLPFNGWFPYHHSNTTGYWVAYFHQNLADFYAAMIGFSFDTVVWGVMIQNSSQLKILKHRLENFIGTIAEDKRYQDVKQRHLVVRSLERKIIKELVNHHQLIIQYSCLSNDLFSPIIFLQYGFSSVILCMCVQSLTRLSFMSPEFIFIVVYLGCMLSQIYLFCWYGNEVTLESMEISTSIYKMNWYELTNECKKDLLIMKNRTLRPIKYTSGYLIELSLNSFVTLIKFSYSAYNLLQQRS